MKIREIPIFAFFLSFLMLIILGCGSDKTQQKTSHKTIEQEGKRPDSYKSSEHTMASLWELRKNQEHVKLLEEIDRFLANGIKDNDKLGTCYFLKADSYRQLGDFPNAKATFTEVINKYPSAKWFDPEIKGYIHVKPLSEVGLMLASDREQCPFPERSENYTTFAWKYLNKEQYDNARFMALACIKQFSGLELDDNQFKGPALEQQKAHNTKYPKGTLPELSPNPIENEEILKQFWALYDVGTCCFIMGQAYEIEADGLSGSRDNFDQAREFYNKAINWYDIIIENYPGAQCFDPTGPWYWSVKKGAEDRKIEIVEKISKLKE